MKLSTLAVSLISAGLATIITAKVVEKQMLEVLDERVQEEVEASVTYLESTGKAEATEEYEEQRTQLFGTKFNPVKPSLDEVANKNQKIRYDAIVKSAGYSPDETAVSDDGDVMKAEGELEVTSTLGDIHPISVDEYMANESGFMQSTITVYADGGVLDEDFDIIPGYQDLIGGGTPPFGEAHVVYLRNNKLRKEYEVIQEDVTAAEILAETGPGGVT
jgi:hypothetical protein